MMNDDQEFDFKSTSALRAKSGHSLRLPRIKEIVRIDSRDKQ